MWLFIPGGLSHASYQGFLSSILLTLKNVYWGEANIIYYQCTTVSNPWTGSNWKTCISMFHIISTGRNYPLTGRFFILPFPTYPFLKLAMYYHGKIISQNFLSCSDKSLSCRFLSRQMACVCNNSFTIIFPHL